MTFSQKGYTKSMAKKCKIKNTKLDRTPMETNSKICNEEPIE